MAEVNAAGASVFPLKVQGRKDGDCCYYNRGSRIVQGAAQSFFMRAGDKGGWGGKGGRGNPAPTRFGWVWVGAPLAAPPSPDAPPLPSRAPEEGRGKRRPYDEGRF